MPVLAEHRVDTDDRYVALNMFFGLDRDMYTGSTLFYLFACPLDYIYVGLCALEQASTGLHHSIGILLVSQIKSLSQSNLLVLGHERPISLGARRD